MANKTSYNTNFSDLFSSLLCITGIFFIAISLFGAGKLIWVTGLVCIVLAGIQELVAECKRIYEVLKKIEGNGTVL